jgi:hypothetical protein
MIFCSRQPLSKLLLPNVPPIFRRGEVQVTFDADDFRPAMPLIAEIVTAAIAEAFDAERERIRAEKPPAVDRVLLSQDEAAEALGVSPRKLYELRRRGLPCVRLPSEGPGEKGQPRYRPEDLAQFAARYLITAAEPGDEPTKSTMKIAGRPRMAATG